MKAAIALADTTEQHVDGDNICEYILHTDDTTTTQGEDDHAGNGGLINPQPKVTKECIPGDGLKLHTPSTEAGDMPDNDKHTNTGTNNKCPTGDLPVTKDNTPPKRQR